MVGRLLPVVLPALLACGGDVEPSGPGSGGAGGQGASVGSSSGSLPAASSSSSGSVVGSGTGGAGPTEDILDYLAGLPGVTVDEQDSGAADYRFFVLTFEQPADHQEPDGQVFLQRATLMHTSWSAPTILESTGYGIDEGPYLDEPAALLGGNQILVEHRFFTPSRPDPADWADLTIEQAAADHHRIVELLKPAYTAPWISTGISKGGMTSMYHRRFYPDDVTGTVAYVAPHNSGLTDPRYAPFLAAVGDETCREALKTVQLEALLRREAMMDRMLSQGWTYDILGDSMAFETAVVYLPWSFWQYQLADQCSTVPAASASDDDIWNFLDLNGSPALWSDDFMIYYEPYYWQVAVQIGTGNADHAYLAALMLHPDIDDPMNYILPGPGKTPVFDPGAMPDISDWLASEGERFIWIYGENDPYSATAFDPTGVVDGHRLYEAGGNHLSSISGLDDADRQEALDALQAWTGVVPRALTPREPGSRDEQRMAWFRRTQRVPGRAVPND